ncbi:MAG: ribonuclease J [Nitrospirota bacterium]|nr:ribonuclease J [Nitrospirota bacterium]
MTTLAEDSTGTTPSVRIIPLGGIGEIGMNMTVYESEGRIIVVDCGVLFPEDDLLGIDLIIPDFTYLVENRDRVLGLFLTHGHEDHIGAVSYFLREFDVPVLGTPLTLGLLESKLRQSRKAEEMPKLISLVPREKYTMGPFTVEPVRITHSIADGVSFAIRTSAGTILHTGDFKVDLTPIDDLHIDIHRFCQLGEEGILALLSDSTNSEKEGLSLSERLVGENLDRFIQNSPGRVIVSTFSSNIHRLQQVADVSIRHGRFVAFTGRSMENNYRVASELGHLHIPSDRVIKIDAASAYPPEKLTIITTGSQGEPMSGLFRMAVSDHKHVAIGPGDTVLLSSRVIPGNERSIDKIINLLLKKGAVVHFKAISDIHVSGHASAEDQKLMIRMLKPRHFVPIHGEFRHLSAHARTARKTGIPDDRVHIIENGDVLEFDSEGGRIQGKVTTGRTLIDGKGVGDVGEGVIRDRKRLASDGMVTVIVGLSRQDGQALIGPEVFARGVVLSDRAQEMDSLIRAQVLVAIDGADPEIRAEPSALKTRIHNHLRKYFKKQFDRDPMIVPVILEI